MGGIEGGRGGVRELRRVKGVSGSAGTLVCTVCISFVHMHMLWGSALVTSRCIAHTLERPCAATEAVRLAL